MVLWECSWWVGEVGRVWLGVFNPDEVGVDVADDMMVEGERPESIRSSLVVMVIWIFAAGKKRSSVGCSEEAV